MLPHPQATSKDHGGPRHPTFRLRGGDVTTSPRLPIDSNSKFCLIGLVDWFGYLYYFHFCFCFEIFQRILIINSY